MEQTKHFTEEELQSYFDNSFTESPQFKEHLKSCNQCSKSLQAYSLVWSFVKNYLTTESLKINLTASVVEKVFPKKKSRFAFEIILNGVFFLLILVCLLICFNFLFMNSVPIIKILLFLIPLILYFLLSLKEVKIVHDKFILFE